MSRIHLAMTNLISVFNEYAGREGDKKTLTKGELKDLLNKEMKGMLDTAKDKSKIDQIFSDLDMNKDNAVDFNEYVCLVASLTCLCFEFMNQ